MDRQNILYYMQSALSALDNLQQELSDYAEESTDPEQSRVARDAIKKASDAYAAIDEVRFALSSAGFGGGHSVKPYSVQLADLVNALDNLNACNWLDVNSCDSEELALAKKQARGVLSKARGK